MNGWLKKADDWINAHRPWAVLITVSFTIGVVALINSITGSDLFRQFFFPKVCASNKPPTCDPLAWKDLFQAAILILGLPVAFLLWHWRDRNVRDQIENARKDINLKEFQEVQQRAAGALDESLLAEARQQLQIAALHQLRGFLRGEYGESFERPAFELLLAGHAAAMERVGLLTELDDLRGSEPKLQNLGAEIKKAKFKAAKRWTAIDRERALIIGDEWRAVFNKKWPLSGRRFDGIKLPEGAALGGLDLTYSVFVGADMSKAHLRGAGLNRAHLESATMDDVLLDFADLRGAYLESAKLSHASLERADLRDAHLESSTLQQAYLKGADLTDAHLEDANLHYTNLEGANLRGINPASLASVGYVHGAVYDDQTIFIDLKFWSEGDPTADEVREQWREKGARHVDERQ